MKITIGGKGYVRYRVTVASAYHWMITGHHGTLPDHVAEYITLSDDVPPSDRQVVAALKVAGFIKKNVRYASVGINATDTTLYVTDAKTGEPIYNLEPDHETDT